MNVHDLQAPTADGGVLFQPPPGAVGSLLQENQRRLAVPQDILGISLAELRGLARREVLSAARCYLAEADQAFPDPPPGPLIVAGHQPELFHPGVWLKNFTLAAMARRHDGVALNLVVDNDTAKNALLHVPADGRLVRVPYDHWQSAVPFEERQVLDEDLFRSLPKAVGELTAAWPFTPLLGDYWAEVCQQADRTPLLGERFVAARRAFERRWGCANFEVPLSRICQTEAFAWFACHLCSNLELFQAIYNGEVQAYRKRYHMRSRHHPVPDLARAADWLEAPLWAWRSGGKHRERLFVRRAAGGLELRAGAEAWPTLRSTSQSLELIGQWRSLEQAGFKIRTRALTTTLFARLFLGDLFVHGLGGGKYDKLTDDIMRRFYNIEPPEFAVVTGTLLLPLPHVDVGTEDHMRWQSLQRDLWWNPQRHVNGVPPAQNLREQKIDWIARPVGSPQQNRERYETLRKLTSELRPFVRDQADQARKNLDEAERDLQTSRVRGRRDYAFCLYPEGQLRRFCSQ